MKIAYRAWGGIRNAAAAIPLRLAAPLILLGGALAFAARETPAQPPAPAPPGASAAAPASAEIRFVRGKLVSYDPVGATLTLEETGRAGPHPPFTAALAERALVRLDGKSAAPAALQPGDVVTLRYRMEAGRPVAFSARALRELRLPAR